MTLRAGPKLSGKHVLSAWRVHLPTGRHFRAGSESHPYRQTDNRPSNASRHPTRRFIISWVRRWAYSAGSSLPSCCSRRSRRHGVVAPTCPTSPPTRCSPQRSAHFRRAAAGGGNDFVLFAKVRLGDILQIERESGGQAALRGLWGHLVQTRRLRAVRPAHLPGGRRGRARRPLAPAAVPRQRDEFFDAALAKAAVPLLRGAGGQNYLVEALRADLTATLETKRRK